MLNQDQNTNTCSVSQTEWMFMFFFSINEVLVFCLVISHRKALKTFLSLIVALICDFISGLSSETKRHKDCELSQTHQTCFPVGTQPVNKSIFTCRCLADKHLFFSAAQTIKGNVLIFSYSMTSAPLISLFLLTDVFYFQPLMNR